MQERLASLEPTVILEATPERILIDRRNLRIVNDFLAIELLRRAWSRAGWPEREMSTARWVRLHHFTVQPKRRSRLSLGSGVEAILKEDQLILSRTEGPDLPTEEAC